jgi:PKD repeat protein
MKKVYSVIMLMLFLVSATYAQQFTYSDSWGSKAGFNLVNSKASGVGVVYSIKNFAVEDMDINGTMMKTIMLPDNFLPNNAGAPNVPGNGRIFAIPQGSTPKLKILSQRVEVIHNIDLAPAPVIPAENDDRPFNYTKDMAIYSANEFYPAQPVIMSNVEQIRGTDVVILGISPFQYNPVTKDLLVYRDIEVSIEFEGGKGTFGNDSYRSQWWDPIMEDAIMNFSSLPKIDYNKKLQSLTKGTRDTECEYIIICPTGQEFVNWADSLAKFRNEQGILTHVYTVDEVGGNTTTAIESFIDNAYNTWTLKPAACLLLGDYGTDGTKSVISPIITMKGETFPSDNVYADVDGDEMPDVVFSRMTANNEAQLEVLCTKILNYERTPPTNPDFYAHPITALGWQTVRWFQLCSEIVGGYFTQHGKTPVRINAVFEGNPNTDPWSTAQNSTTIINTFGPNGLGYIPATPQELGGWTGGNATQINNAVNSGAFILQHRDHGNVTLWGEPAYNNGNVNGLTNTDLTFVFSINCLTGKYNNGSECLGEKFHRHTADGHNSGALGVICPSETSYSFVNDTFVWGMYDNMWPDFMPAYGTTPASRGMLPSFAHAAGKYFLKQSNWPYNQGDKQITYFLFHHHGDAFMRLFSEVPQELTISHDTVVQAGATTFTITVNDSAMIGLTVNGELIATGLGAGTTPVIITIPAQPVGTIIKVTASKDNYYRYSALVPVVSDVLTANFSANATGICTGGSVNFTDMSSASPTGWEWTFDGGTPATSTEQNPQNIFYSTSGEYNVTLKVTKGTESQTTTKETYIHVSNYPEATFTATNLCLGAETQFTDQTNPNGGSITSWEWNFGDPASGVNNASTTQNPVHVFTAAGTYQVILTVVSNGTCIDDIMMEITILNAPGVAGTPEGTATLCQGTTGALFVTSGADYANSYQWVITPAEAGTFTGNTTEATLDLAPAFFGVAVVKVMGVNDCAEGELSTGFEIHVTEVTAAPLKPTGPDTADVNVSLTDAYTTEAVNGATSYVWNLTPVEAGTISGDSYTGTVTWNADFRGVAMVTVRGFSGDCEGFISDPKEVIVRSTLAINENEGIGLTVYPNPTAGKVNVTMNTNGNMNVSLKVYNVLGTIVFENDNLTVNGKLAKTIDLTSLPKGIYHLKVEGNGKSVVKKIVINH